MEWTGPTNAKAAGRSEIEQRFVNDDRCRRRLDNHNALIEGNSFAPVP
jgi:hypothetical protein